MYIHCESAQLLCVYVDYGSATMIKISLMWDCVCVVFCCVFCVMNRARTRFPQKCSMLTHSHVNKSMISSERCFAFNSHFNVSVDLCFSLQVAWAISVWNSVFAASGFIVLGTWTVQLNCQPIGYFQNDNDTISSEICASIQHMSAAIHLERKTMWHLLNFCA